jgi:hypothetical protein
VRITVLGGGIEAAISANWTAKVEYLNVEPTYKAARVRHIIRWCGCRLAARRAGAAGYAGDRFATAQSLTGRSRDVRHDIRDRYVVGIVRNHRSNGGDNDNKGHE